MTKIVVSVETEVWTVRLPDPDDSWDAGDTGGRVVGVRAWTARDWEQNSFRRYGGYDSWEGGLAVNPGDYVYAVVADYESGSTFGRDGGHASVLDVFADITMADELAQVAENAVEYSFRYNGRDYYASWLGYFESLNEMRVWAVKVNG
jgi:hypothetical protein